MHSDTDKARPMHCDTDRARTMASVIGRARAMASDTDRARAVASDTDRARAMPGAGVPTLFGLQATFKMTKSKWSTYIKNAKHIFIYIYIYTEYTSYIQDMLVYWQEVSVVVSMASPKVPLHISLIWNSNGRLADQTNTLQIWHCEINVLLPFRMEVLSFLFLTWYSTPTHFYTLSSGDIVAN